MLSEKELERFGQLLVENVIDDFLILFYATTLQDRAVLINNDLSIRLRKEFTTEQFELIEKLFVECITGSVSNFLWRFKDIALESNVVININGVPITETKENLQIRLYSDEGWMAKFSQFFDENGSHISRFSKPPQSSENVQSTPEIAD
jgi:hypothetical protein